MIDTLFLNVIDDRFYGYSAVFEEMIDEFGRGSNTDLRAAIERRLAGYVELYYCIHVLRMKWANSVFVGDTGCCPEFERQVKQLFEKWLSFNSRIDICLSHFDVIDGANKYRDAVELAEVVLCDWKSPTLSEAVGLRTMKLDKKQSEEFNRICSDEIKIDTNCVLTLDESFKEFNDLVEYSKKINVKIPEEI